MAIHAPGRVGLIKARGVLARAMRHALPSLAPAGQGRRGSTVALSMTSMIDVFVVLTVFLLLTFSSSAECGCRRDLRLPPAWNVSELVDAPLIDVRSDAIWVDGVLVAHAADLEAQRGRVARLDGLFATLKAKRESAKRVAPGKEPPSQVILAIDGEVPAAIVKSVVMTAARSGYGSIDFMVQVAPKG